MMDEKERVEWMELLEHARADKNGTWGPNHHGRIILAVDAEMARLEEQRTYWKERAAEMERHWRNAEERYETAMAEEKLLRQERDAAWEKARLLGAERKAVRESLGPEFFCPIDPDSPLENRLDGESYYLDQGVNLMAKQLKKERADNARHCQERDAASEDARQMQERLSRVTEENKRLRAQIAQHDANCECAAEAAETRHTPQQHGLTFSMECGASAGGSLDGMPYSIKRHKDGNITIEVGP